MIEFNTEVSSKSIGIISAVSPNLDSWGRTEYTVRTVYKEEVVWALVYISQKTANIRINIGDIVRVQGQVQIIYNTGDDNDAPFNSDDLYLSYENPEIYVLRGK